MAKELKDLTKRSENYSQWYNDLVVKADLAEQSAVRGCMVIKPYGYAIWEKMQRQLIDIGIAAAHISLAAEAEGLGSCILGWFDEKELKQLAGIPASKRLLLDIVIGYPAKEKRKKIRKPKEKVISYNRY